MGHLDGAALRIRSFRMKVQPGITVAALTNFAGKPDLVVRKDEALNRRARFRIPSLDDHTAVYFYPEEGIPYFNVFVFVDEREMLVTTSVLERLW